MTDTPFSFFTRPSKDRKTGKPVTRLCVRFYDGNRRVIQTATLKATNEKKAYAEVHNLLAGGVIGVADALVLDYLTSFWKQDSDYACLKALHGRPLSKRYIDICALVVKKHLEPPRVCRRPNLVRGYGHG